MKYNYWNRTVYGRMLMIHSCTSTSIVMKSRHPSTNLSAVSWTSATTGRPPTAWSSTAIRQNCCLADQVTAAPRWVAGIRYSPAIGADTNVACSHVRLLGVNIFFDLSLDNHAIFLITLLSFFTSVDYWINPNANLPNTKPNPPEFIELFYVISTTYSQIS